jgi:putative transcriptional regulator
MKPLQGQFLVASPHLADGNFYKSVVLMIKHDEEGAFGLILNRPTESTVTEIWRMVGEEDEIDCPQPIYMGGPVSGPLVALHRLKGAAEAEVIPGVYFSAHKEQLGRVVRGNKPFRLYTGYAGWAEGQLEGELHVGGWLTAKAKKNLIFHEGDDLWEQLVATIGRDFLGQAIRPKHVPDDPSLN